MRNRLIVCLLFFTFTVCSVLPALAGARRVYTGKLNVNTASATELISLPGVGKIIAARIIEERKKLGAFKETTDLKRIKDLSGKRYKILEKFLDVKGETTLHVYTDLNTASKSLLARIPGISKGEA